MTSQPTCFWNGVHFTLWQSSL